MTSFFCLRKAPLWAVLLMVGLGAGCRKTETASYGDYPEQVKAIITNKCTSCHNSSRKLGGLDLSSYTALFQGSQEGAVLVPYSIDWSPLLWHVNNYIDLGKLVTPNLRMPYKQVGSVYETDTLNALSRAEVTALNDWVMEGAPDSDGNKRWTSLEARTDGKMFVLCQASDLIAVVDLASNQVTRYFEVGILPATLEAPHYITISPDRQFLYVTLLSGGAVEKYRTDNYTKVGRLAAGPSCAHVHLSPDGTRGVVSHWTTTESSLKLTIFDATSMTMLDQLNDNSQFTAKPHGFKLFAGMDSLILTNNNGNFMTMVYLNGDQFDANRAPRTIDINPNFGGTGAVYQPYDVVLNDAQTVAYVTCYGTPAPNSDSSMVGRLDLRTGRFTAFVKRQSGVEGLGLRPRLLTQANGKLYVVCAAEANFSQQGNRLGCVSVINLSTFQWEQNIYRVGNTPHGIAINSRTNRIYISSENQNGVDPPHHAVQGQTYNPGKLNIADVNTNQVLGSYQTEIPPYGTAVAILP
jgi:DNA-binding beta-propeller fold protein YncE